MPIRGYQFTWEKSKGTPNWIEERLDKVLAMAGWGGMNENAWVENIRTRASDHSTLYLNINAISIRRGRGPRGFRFEMAWLLDEGCKDVVMTAWQEGRSEGLLNCQQYCGGKLMRWGGDHFHKFGDRIRQLRQRMENIRNRRDPTSLAEFQQINNQLNQLEAQEEVFWKQRAKQHWLRGTDANTKFYHRYASARKKKNYIASIKNNAGVWVEGNDMHSVILDYFRSIFASNSANCSDPLFDNFQPRVSHDQNVMLGRDFVVDEVKE
ncbi:PREDICTED: uncharacterized protein LOC109168241 [Ipomoea nil]|uniref:uncharacterized protein LOC109168241 n=1 Tax=Ipomoea nil TaxID=35883 RepID=UPI000900C46F|nr:PREDICTED: uncharacterized protein LOC109168241 [Ipomoea nil]